MELFNGTIDVSYGQFYLHPEDFCDIDMEAAFLGQSNGLCGAAAAPLVFFMTGLHTGNVGLSMYLNESEPQLSADWEEVVEVPLDVSTELHLTPWGDPWIDALPVPAGRYRLRYAGNNMDRGHEADCVSGDEETVDSYRIDLWPVPESTPDRIVRQHGEQAAYWHGTRE